MRVFLGLTALPILFCMGVFPAHADFMNLTSLTNGPAGSFTGTLNGVSVSGSITSSVNNTFRFNAATDPTNSYEVSHIDGTSPQFRYTNIYEFNSPLADTVGYTKFQDTSSSAQIVINFGAAFTNLVLDFANDDGSVWDFSPTSGLTGLAILSGNGGADGDGLGVSGKTMFDLNPTTGVGEDPNTAPLTSGARSAYGSVELEGTYTSLTIDITTARVGGGDGGNFTLVATPEPGSMVLLATVAACLAAAVRSRAKRSV